MNVCRICGMNAVAELLDAGSHPVSNRFLADASTDEQTFPIVLGQCSACGLVQLTKSVPAPELVAPYDWISYNEPEGHLDRMVDLISDLRGVSRASVVAGLSFKDDSTLQRFRSRGFDQTWRVDPRSDLSIENPCAGLESIQDCIDPMRAEHLGRAHGTPDIVIGRHILEHAHDTQRFMAGLRALVHPDGYLVLEVPDCTLVLDTFDYTTIWEEHVLYFTPETYRRAFAFNGFAVECFVIYLYPHENSLVAIVRPDETVRPEFPDPKVLDAEKRRAQAFAEALAGRREAVHSFLQGYRRNQGRIALFGAGHLACMFIDLMGIEDQIDFVIDDHPRKRGLFMPGSHLPIVGSDALAADDVKLCLTSLSPESEEKVIAKNQAFVECGGRFASLFPASKRALECDR